MRRVGRRALWQAALGLGGCSVLPSRPYLPQRSWPLAARRSPELPAPVGGRVLLVRGLGAAPGLESRGLQTLEPDGSVQLGYYEQWSVAPADAVGEALRLWLADSGIYAAVVAPGSRLAADLVLEGELQALVAEPARRSFHIALAWVLLGRDRRLLLQRRTALSVPLASDDAPAIAAAGQVALARLLGGLEQDVRPASLA